LLVHENGIDAPGLEKLFKNRIIHDPMDLDGARHYAEAENRVRLGLFYRNGDLPCYEDTREVVSVTAAEKIEKINTEFDRYAV
jgi:2-oxoglutarate ferredoxin oxidoreductase subunit beta